ncbi:cation diffusion facilitator family transporter [Staphylospora marina]|uniref:cation diffusion facilitator family transporter n=1 Tax=Staphylospora marina TaxID=2490858 RepID=UPI001F14C37B|nr:cation diffusion facilitator family transporter [Staphylospora marina]
MSRRLSEVRKGAWLSLTVNLFLAVLKTVVGWLFGSRALLADGINSATDVVSSLAVLYGIRLAHTPPDEEHPYGHGKAEIVISAVISMIVAWAGIEAGITAAKAFFKPLEPPTWPALAAGLLSIAVKEGMFRYSLWLGTKWNSRSMIASAWDHRADAVATVAALVGIAGAMVAPVVGAPWLALLDPMAGVLVAVLILRVAVRLFKDALRSGMDRVLEEEEVRGMKEVADSVPGVIRIDRLLAREHGHYVIVDIRVAVDPRITVEEGHAIGKQVKRKLLESFDHVEDVFVHLNPWGEDEH